MKLGTSLPKYGVWLVIVWTVGLYAMTSSGCTEPTPTTGSTISEPAPDPADTVLDDHAQPAVCGICAQFRAAPLAAGAVVNPLCTDCHQCGDGICNNGEDHSTCSGDCPVTPPPPPPATCGNNRCDGSETPASCPHDCFCGDGRCSAGENINNCREDCCAHANPPCTV